MQIQKTLAIDGLNGYEFEDLVVKIMRKKGYLKVRNIQGSKDLGKDIIMENSQGEITVVECKHNKLVGRPIVQKLQGAMNHEETKSPGKVVKGMIVTSGSFSKEALDYIKSISHSIELIDGKKLKLLCDKLNMSLTNGKIQIINNKSVPNISEKEAETTSLQNFAKIHGSNLLSPVVSAEVKLIPVCFIEYDVEFNTYTSVGCIDQYSTSGGLIINGSTGEAMPSSINEFLGRLDINEISKSNLSKKQAYEFTENEIEKRAINFLIVEHTHNASYVGKNNVSYTKACTPKSKDITIKQFVPLYLPFWENKIKVLDFSYVQSFFPKKEKRLYMTNNLTVCKICSQDYRDYKAVRLCLDCGRVVCNKDSKLDFLDNKTPICDIHKKPLKLFIETKFFAKKENLNKYKQWWESQNILKRIYEDKLLTKWIIVGSFLLFLLFGAIV